MCKVCHFWGISFVFLRLPSKFPSQISHPDWPPAFCLKRPWLACIHVQIGPKSLSWNYAWTCICVRAWKWVLMHTCACMNVSEQSKSFLNAPANSFLCSWLCCCSAEWQFADTTSQDSDIAFPPFILFYFCFSPNACKANKVVDT